jgi:hypothetical protein
VKGLPGGRPFLLEEASPGLSKGEEEEKKHKKIKEKTQNEQT